jgi:hypothetical protein
MKLLYKKNLILFTVAMAGICCMNYSTGPALGGLSVTGASFGTFGSGTYCTSCHSGGSYAAAADIELLSNGVPVTGNYVPGWAYTLRISRSANASLPFNGGFGFQITCVNDGSNTNINTWGTPPAQTANRTTGGRNYIEHTTKINKSVATIDIPWTAPAAGTGTVRFYLAVNTVNGNGATSGDQPIALSESFTQAPLPVTWLYFRGSYNGSGNLLEWAVVNEKDNKSYRIEKSTDGINFELLREIDAMPTLEFAHQYSHVDLSPDKNTYYRIAQIDFDGAVHYYKTIQIKMEQEAAMVCHTSGDQLKVQLRSEGDNEIGVAIFDMNGRKLEQVKQAVTAGLNTITLHKPLVSGVYFVSAEDRTGKVYRQKISVQ